MIVAALAVTTPRAAIVAMRSIVTGARRCATSHRVLEKMRFFDNEKCVQYTCLNPHS